MLRRLFRVYERVKAARTSPAGPAPGGLTLPPPTLRVRVAGTADVAAFLHGGRMGADVVRQLLSESGRTMGQCRAILDFGCGCGRVLRHFQNLTGSALYGADVDEDLVQWCATHLPFAKVSVNPAEAPAPFPGEFFDAIYAFSVLTHMPAAAQKRWLREFHRMMKPGGLLIFSTHGGYYVPRLDKEEQRQFMAGSLVVRFRSAAGSNLCNAYHPESFVRRELAEGWEVAAFHPEGARGNPRQDVWVFRRV